MGQDVFVLAPFAKETAHLNPLAGLDPEAADYVERIKGIVEALVIAARARTVFGRSGRRSSSRG